MESIRIGPKNVADVTSAAISAQARRGLGTTVLVLDVPLQCTGLDELGLDALTLEWSAMEVAVQAKGKSLFLGWAQASQPLRFAPRSMASQIHLQVSIPDQQFAELEELRDGQPLDLNVVLRGIARPSDHGFSQQVCFKLDRDVWSERVLKFTARAPGALVEYAIEDRGVVGEACIHLKAAVALQRQQLHQDSVKECRAAIECIVSSGSLPRHTDKTTLGEAGKMTVGERGGLVMTAAFKFMHLAAHSGPSGREMDRHDSTFAISIVGGLIRLAQRYGKAEGS